MIEIWKDVPDYEGLYQVSNLGNVKSLERHDRFNRFIPEHIVSVEYNKQGYARVTLYKNGKEKTFQIHVLVMLAFVGPRPEGMDICHNDGDHTNNVLENLRYDSHSNNMIDMVKQNRQHLQKLSVEDVLQIRKLLESNCLTQQEIAKKFNVAQTQIANIKARTSWKWLD